MSTELFVSRRGQQTWAALREGGKTAELRVESPSEFRTVGRIARAKVTRILPGIQSAFVDLGEDRDGFLHVTDLWLHGEQAEAQLRAERLAGTLEGESPLDEEGRNGGSSQRPVAPAPIQDRLKVGRELIVQVARGRLGNKGARVTCYLTLPGRLLVLFPQLTLRSVSRRIVDTPERERLLAILQELPGDVGFVARTAAAGAAAADLLSDAEGLLEAYRSIEREASAGGPPGVVHGDVELAQRLIRDAPPGGYTRIVIDDAAMHERAREYAAQHAPGLLGAIEKHDAPRALFELEGLDNDIEKALRPRVWLKSGGYIVIERTEALVSIDVNTGKFLGKRLLEETAFTTNMEAAKEIARQLRLRDLGGIIVIDFIDMLEEAHQQEVVTALTDALKHDRARTNVHPLSGLGLLQLTRKRTRQAPEDLLTHRCGECHGAGRRKRAETVAVLAVGELLRQAEATPDARFVISARRAVLDALGVLPEHIETELQEVPDMPSDRYEIRLIPTSEPG